VRAPSATGWFLSDHLWERWMELALALFRDGKLDEAGGLWQAAHDIARTFVDNDPRRAASLDALGTLAAARGDRTCCEQLYREALDAWEAAQTWVDRMQVAQAARSSMFHLRLESKHRGAYAEVTRARHVKTRLAGEAGTTAKLAVLANDPDAMGIALERRRDAFGRRETGAAAMAAAIGQTVDERMIDRWSERPPVRYDDERRLYAAALLAPTVLPAPDKP
jgi:hypothetical protein